MEDEKVDGRPKYHGFFAEDIIKLCKANDAENSVITEKKNALVNLFAQIARWDLEVGNFIVHPKDFDEDLLDIKRLTNNVVAFDSGKRIDTPVFVDPYMPRGTIIAVSKVFYGKEPSRYFAIADFPEKLSTYLHLSNSGITFSVCDRGHGPQIEINQSTFGNLQNKTVVCTNKDSLRKIGKMFIEASEQEYSKEYVCIAKDISDEVFSSEPKTANWTSDTK